MLQRYSALRERQRVVEADFAECFADADAADDDDAGSPAARIDDDVYALAVDLGLDAPSRYQTSAAALERSAREAEPSSYRATPTRDQRMAAAAARDVYAAAGVVDGDIDALAHDYDVPSVSSVASDDAAVERELASRVEALRR